MGVSVRVWAVFLAISKRGEVFTLLWSRLPFVTGRRGFCVGGWPFLHVSGRHWIIRFVSGSLFNRMAYLLVWSCTWIQIGGMEASISFASVGVVWKAAQIRHSALLWTFSSGFVWVLVPLNHVGAAYKILGTTHDRYSLRIWTW
jgi:hypothetical protein